MYNYNQIQQIHLEISTRCNATCPLCPRNLYGVEVIDDYPIHDMRLNEAQQIFPSDFLQQISQILINGNLGDFVTARDGLEIVRYFIETNPKIHIEISTNASARPGIWEELGKLKVSVSFAIDGLKDTHHLYRQYTDWDLIIANAKSFITAGGIATWKMIKFDHNQHQIDQCRTLSKELGFKRFILIEHGRDHGPVFNRDKKLTHLIGKSIDPTDFTELKRIKFIDRASEDFSAQPIPKKIICEAKKFKSVYVTATGLAYPCCFTGFYPGQMNHKGNTQIAKLQHNNNIHKVGMKQAIEWFNQIEAQWTKPDYESGSLYICNSFCGTNQ